MTRAKDISKIITDADFSGTLDVTGTVTADGLTVENSTTPTINIKSTDAVVVADDVVGAITFEESDATGGTGVQAFIKAIANDSGNTYDMSIGVGGNTEAIRVDQSGNVGIGTSSPVASSLLTLKETNAGGDGAELRLINSSTTVESATQIVFTNTTTDSANSAVIKAVRTASGQDFRFSSDGTERMRINASGNVGIGESSPDKLLHLKTSQSVTCEIKIEAPRDRGRLSFHSQTNSGTDYEMGKIEIDRSSGTLQTAHMIFATNGGSGNTERMRIDSNGSITSTAASGNMASFSSTTNAVEFKILSPTGNVVRLDTGTSDVLAFAPAGTERMRLHNNGLISIGNTSADAMLNITNNYPYTAVRTNSDSTNGHFQIEFHNPNGRVGNITTTGSSTAYNTTSDYRLKGNVTADWDATTRLKQLNPVRFNFIADADTTVDGFLAHEVQSVVPEAITGTHNEVDNDGNPVYQGIDQSKLVPLLVKTIQELEARIVALETA